MPHGGAGGTAASTRLALTVAMNAQATMILSLTQCEGDIANRSRSR